MGIADGEYTIVLIATAIVLASLFLFTKLETWIDHINQTHNYKIVSLYKPDLLEQYEQMFRQHKLQYKRLKQSKNGEYISGSWMVNGLEKNHNSFIEKILHDSSVKEFEF
jgi:putative Mg2+ transporter-C (MgtC) family protein